MDRIDFKPVSFEKLIVPEINLPTNLSDDMTTAENTKG